MLKKSIVLICIMLIGLSCSNTVKGPITGKKYNVNVGGSSDMEKYKETREEAMTPDESLTPLDKPRDCNVVDCPDSVREVSPDLDQ